MDAAPAPEALPAYRARGTLHQLASAGGVRLLVGFHESREYIDVVTGLTRIPRAPSWLLGVFGSDSGAVPLVDIEAWALHVQPQPWQAPREQQTAGALAGASHSTGTTDQLHALRMNDGADAWAIRLSHSPSVVDLRDAQEKDVDFNLPLGVSAANGGLMSYATQAWFLADKTVALQLRWESLAQAIRKELSGISAAEERKK